MIVLPAVDLYEKKAVRLLRGEYEQMTVYSDSPVETAKQMEAEGASWLHTVDLEGARDGTAPNLCVVERIAKETRLSVEFGGGIRSMETLDRVFAAGVRRAILGTAAVTDRAFLEKAAAKYGDGVAVGADLRDGAVAIRGWRETSGEDTDAFLRRLEKMGVGTVVCTDISRDGALGGSNLGLYRSLSERFSFRLIASGGVSSAGEIRALKEMGVWGAILGKAYYTGKLSLPEALEAAK